MPILGILASSKLTAAAGDYESIATVTVGSGGAANVTFTSIPQTYTHLQVRAMGKTTTNENHLFQFNSDTGANYKYHYLAGSGASATAGDGGAANGYLGYNNPGTQFAVWVLDILDYENTNKYKTCRTLFGCDGNGSGYSMFTSTLYLSTNAITSIKFFPSGSASFAQYSHFALYGIKSA